MPRRAAQAFVDHLNSVLNRTVSDSRLSLIPDPRDEAAFEISRLVDNASAPLELRAASGLHLFARQIVQVVDGHCRTESYSYRLQATEAIESWLIRWEYYRDRPRADYPYAPAQVHINGQFVDGTEIARLHVPTRRVPLELVIWHAIADWSATPRVDDWQDLLASSIDGFEERRTGH